MLAASLVNQGDRIVLLIYHLDTRSNFKRQRVEGISDFPVFQSATRIESVDDLKISKEHTVLNRNDLGLVPLLNWWISEQEREH
jgi:ribulose 1,5-bisphosphate carboxylase large subunit-like protein